MKFKKYFIAFFLVLTGFIVLSSCSSDQEITEGNADEALVESAKNYLNGDIVLSTKATMSGVDKTLLATGCPTKFKFQWSGTDKQTFNISLLGFTVGAMGMTINFKCDVKCTELNSWEQKEYSGSGWIKFKGENGSCWGQNEDGSDFDGDGTNGSVVKGSFIQGYYNVNTHQIQFVVSYNMMNVRSDCFLQAIDKNRINNYAAEFKQYEKDLAAYKKEHGIK